MDDLTSLFVSSLPESSLNGFAFRSELEEGWVFLNQFLKNPLHAAGAAVESWGTGLIRWATSQEAPLTKAMTIMATLHFDDGAIHNPKAVPAKSVPRCNIFVILTSITENYARGNKVKLVIGEINKHKIQFKTPKILLQFPRFISSGSFKKSLCPKWTSSCLFPCLSMSFSMYLSMSSLPELSLNEFAFRSELGEGCMFSNQFLKSPLHAAGAAVESWGTGSIRWATSQAPLA